MILTDDEALTLNNILVDECLNMVSVVNAQSSMKKATDAMKLLRTAQTGQHYLFDNRQRGDTEFSVNVCKFFRYLVERMIDVFKGEKEEETELEKVIAIGQNIDKLEILLQKIPEKSLIVV